MSAKGGKGGAKPATPQQARKKTAVKKTEAPAGDPDDPFGVSAPVMSNAVPLLPKPQKGKLHRIVCPMCEMPGFQSKKAAGREVRCANKDCLVPVFTAPRLEGDELEEAPRAAAEEKKPVNKSLLLYGGVAIGMILIGGVAVMMNRPPATDDASAPYTPPAYTSSTDDAGTATDPALNSGTEPGKREGKPQPQEPVGPSPDELRTEALALMDKVALIRDRNSRKPFCRRMAAEAYAITGNIEAVETQLQQLEVVGRSLKFYGVTPLVEVGWQHLAAGRSTELQATITRIKQPLETLPEYGTIAVSMAVDYATLLAAADQTDQAISLLKKRRNVEELGQFVETWARSLITPKLGFAAALAHRPVTGWSEPQWATVAFGLSCRGLSDKALAWAQLAPTPRSKTECLSAWAEGQLLTEGSAAVAAIEQQIASLPSADRAFVLARCELVSAIGTVGAPASPLLQKSVESLEESGTPGTVAMPNLKTQLKLNLPDAGPATAAAIAAAEIAHAQHVHGSTDAAWTSMTLAQDWARSMAPSPSQAQEPFDEIKRLGDSRIVQLLKVSQNLLTDEDARNAYKEYRNRCSRVTAAADGRFSLQQKLFAAASDWGLAEKVWSEISTRAQSSEPATAEPWFDTKLPARLHAEFHFSQSSDLKNALETAVTPKRLSENSDAAVPTAKVAADAIAKGDASRAARALENFAARNREDRDQRFRQETALRLASELVAAGKSDLAVAFSGALKDSPQLQEEIFRVIGAESTARGNALAAIVPARGEELTPPERIALLRGIVGAVQETRK
ncbi:MAG: hypothetical protein ACYTGL_12310 [Planctomycetota bacterium]|jgi:hypothetical protein